MTCPRAHSLLGGAWTQSQDKALRVDWTALGFANEPEWSE